MSDESEDTTRGAGSGMTVGFPALDEEMREVVREFLDESCENLDRVDSELIELEERSDDRELLSSIFRSIHTIKGTCGFFGFARLERVTHAGESLLVKLRDGEQAIDEQIATALLGMVDAVRAMLGEIAAHGHDGDDDYAELIGRIDELKDRGRLAAPAADTAGTALGENGSGGDAADRDATDHDAGDGDEDGVGGPATESVAATDASADGGDAATALAEPTTPASATERAAASTARQRVAAEAADASIRVDVPLLDSLMTLVGELVLARNQIVEFVGQHENSRVVAAAQRLNLITSELQEGVMQTRMQPIHSVWAKLPRVVRDLSRACGKQVRVEMRGKSTELDKSLIEAMKDPITHLVRNSVDHGIEMPEARLAAGKPAEGVLELRAFHEGGQVHIEIADDGAGIDAERIRRKALDKGLISAEQSARMSDQEICRMIFLPGLSTADKVTNISGRGVGMDVVKTNIERISGTIDLDTEPGHGTTFKIRVPLTLAIVPALIVTSGTERFAIPQVNLIELIRIDESERETAVEHIHGCPVYRLRGNLLPLVYLNRELGLGGDERGTANIIVLQAEQCRFGLVVDQINDTQEIVVKPLAEALKGISVFAGATIMGDGRVALIFDTIGIGARARVLAENRERLLGGDTADARESEGERETLLLIGSRAADRLAIPLNRVARLEQFERSRTESAGSVSVVQYREQILPLVDLADLLEERRHAPREDTTREAEDGQLQVVVFGENGRQVGLVVEEIVDVVDEVLTVRGPASREGVLGTATVQGRVTELFDVSGFLARTAELIDPDEEAA